VQTESSACIAVVFTYALATLVVLQGIIMLFPVTSVSIARHLIYEDRRRRKREVELAQIFPEVWVQHIVRLEDGIESMVAHRLAENQL
jgi:hypothetical protein